MTIKQKFWTSLGIIFTIFINYYGYRELISNIDQNKEKVYCGTTQGIETQLKSVKYGTRTDYYVLVNFDQIGTRLVDVNSETFYTTKPGERICFNLSNRFVYGNKKTTFMGITGLTLSIIVDFLILILIIIELINLINKTLDKIENEKNTI
jgi:hypothetical protein